MKKTRKLTEVSSLVDVQNWEVAKANKMIEDGHFSNNNVPDKIILLLLSTIQPADKSFTKIVFNKKDLIEILKLNPKRGYAQLDEALAVLQSKIIVMPLGNGYISTTWIASIDATKKREVGLEISQGLKDLLLNLNYDFTKIKIETYFNLSTHYPRRLYEQFKMRLDKSSKKELFFNIDIDKLRALFQLYNVYKMYGDIKRNVLKPSIDEINDAFNINACFEEIKKGRKVVAVRFKISYKTGGDVTMVNTSFLREEIIFSLKSNLFSLAEIKKLNKKGFKYIDLPNENLLKIRRSYKDNISDYVLSKIEFLKQEEKKGKVKNRGAFLSSAIKNNWVSEKQVIRLETSSKKEAKRKKQQEVIEKEAEISKIKDHIYHLKWEVVEQIFKEDREIIAEIVSRSSFQKAEKSLRENMESPLIKGFLHVELEKIFPDRFEKVKEKFSEMSENTLFS